MNLLFFVLLCHIFFIEFFPLSFWTQLSFRDNEDSTMAVYCNLLQRSGFESWSSLWTIVLTGLMILAKHLHYDIFIRKLGRIALPYISTLVSLSDWLQKLVYFLSLLRTHLTAVNRPQYMLKFIKPGDNFSLLLTGVPNNFRV